jgi:hypothetical protein
MTGRYTGFIHSYTVSEKSPRGVINFHISSATPIPPATNTDFIGGDQQFKLDEDSDQTFEAMADICANKAGLFVTPMTIQVLSGAKDEIDTMEI